MVEWMEAGRVDLYVARDVADWDKLAHVRTESCRWPNEVYLEEAEGSSSM